jgi:hypothetical protein
MSFSNTYETNILKWAFTADSVTRPTVWYVGLFTANPGETGGGATEITGNNYSRIAVTLSVSGDTASNTSAVEFPTATGSWGTVTHAAIFDHATAGSQIAYASLSASRAIDTGDVLRFPAGDIDVTLD